jgi:hypothetical protein
MANSSKRGQSSDAIEGHAPLHAASEASGSTQRDTSDGSTLPDEFDHRGIRLPARTRVGGIIIPQ